MNLHSTLRRSLLRCFPARGRQVVGVAHPRPLALGCLSPGSAGLMAGRVGSQGSSLRDALRSVSRMLPLHGRLQLGPPLPDQYPAGHRLPGQPPRPPLRQECILLEQLQWGPCPSGHLLPGRRQPPGPPGRAQVRGTLRERQELREGVDGHSLCFLCPWAVMCGKDRGTVWEGAGNSWGWGGRKEPWQASLRQQKIGASGVGEKNRVQRSSCSFGG